MKKPERLFQPGRIGELELKNRIVMAPMAGLGFSNKFVTERPCGSLDVIYEGATVSI